MNGENYQYGKFELLPMSEIKKETPDKQLAKIIGQALVVESLVSPDKQDKLIQELAAGKVTSEIGDCI